MNGTASAGNALDGFVPRQVTGAQTVKAMVCAHSLRDTLPTLLTLPRTGKRHQPIQWTTVHTTVQGHHEEAKRSTSISTDG